MANLQVTLKRKNGANVDVLFPTTVVEQITRYSDGLTLQQLLDAKVNTSALGAASGVATLDSGQKLTGSQVPTWLMNGGNFYAGSFSTAFNLSTFITTLTTGLGSSQSVTSRYGWFYQCTASADISWTNGTPASTNYVVSPGDEGDTTSPITLEAGDLVVFTKYEIDTVATYTFSIINNTAGVASASAYGIVQLSNATSTASMNGSSKVITEDVLYDVIGTTTGKIAAGDHTHAYQAVDSDLTVIAGLTPVDNGVMIGSGSNLWSVESGATLRTSIGLAIGTDVQAQDAGLQSIANLTTGADKMIYTSASDTYLTTTLTQLARDLLDDGTSATMRTTLGLVIGTDVQAYSAHLAGYVSLAKTDGNFIVGDGANFVVESGATARSSMGVYSTTEVNNLLANRPTILYDTETGAETGTIIIDVD